MTIDSSWFDASAVTTLNRIDVAPGIFTIEHFLGTAECAALIEHAETQGFEAAPIITARGTRIQTDTRNNDRCVFDDVQLARSLWQRARATVPSAMNGRAAIGLNERFRLYRYIGGQQFDWHADVPYHKDNNEMSLLTFIIYLNSGYLGGATRFEAVKVVGDVGLALVFQHGLLHQGSQVLDGVKYALRSDVMFGPVGRVGD